MTEVLIDVLGDPDRFVRAGVHHDRVGIKSLLMRTGSDHPDPGKRRGSGDGDADNRVSKLGDLAEHAPIVPRVQAAVGLFLPRGRPFAPSPLASGNGNGNVDIDVRIDPAAEHRVQARSDNGSIDVDYLTVGDR